MYTARDVVPTKKVWECTQKLAISNQLQTHFKAKREKCVGTPLPDTKRSFDWDLQNLQLTIYLYICYMELKDFREAEILASNNITNLCMQARNRPETFWQT